MLAGLGPATMVMVYDGYGAVSTTAPGVSVVPGATNAEGAWTSIATGTNIANDCYFLLLWISGGNTTANDKSQILDIGVDSAGGTAYQALLSNICCGSSGFSQDGGYFYCFPLFIKGGSQVAARIQGSNGTAGTVRVAPQFWGRPSNVEETKTGRYSETIGTITNSGGQSFTPGTSAAEGAWQSLGTTTRSLWWWQLTVQCSNGTITALQYAFDLAYGDASNKHFIVRRAQMAIAGTAEKLNYVHPPFCYCDVPAGATLYVRGSCSGTPVTGFNATAVGIGG